MVDKKGLIFFISGLVLGAAGGGYAVFRYTKNYYEKVNEEAALERAEYYHNKYNDIPVKEGSAVERVVEEESNDEVKADEEKTYKEIADIYKSSDGDRLITDYRSISSGDSSLDNRPAPKKKSRKKKPYVITQEFFDENELEYDKKFVTYYEADNTFVDDETDEVIDIREELGENNLFDADESLLVANDTTKTMYSVEIVHRAFSEEGI